MTVITNTTVYRVLLLCCGPAQTDVSLRVSPDRCQFFKHEFISLSCEEEENSTLGWSVKRTTEKENGTCNSEWGVINGVSCFMQVQFLWDSGAYCCQSESGELSRSIDITVSDGAVILESPVHPVMEGRDVTLRCLSKTKARKASSNVPADFYKDGSLIGTESTGQMTIHSVHQSDEGFYKCSISDLGESPESWMNVRDSSSPPAASSPSHSLPHMSLSRLIVQLVVVTPYVVSTILLILIHRDGAGVNMAREEP